MRANERKKEAGTGAGTGREHERERRWRLEDEYKMGTGTGAGAEMRAIAEMETGTVTETETGHSTSRKSVSPLSRLIRGFRHKYVSLVLPWEDQCEWRRMTRMTGLDCAIRRNLINTHTHTHAHKHIHAHQTHTQHKDADTGAVDAGGLQRVMLIHTYPIFIPHIYCSRVELHHVGQVVAPLVSSC